MSGTFHKLPDLPIQKLAMATATMKALNYLGPYQVRVEDVEKPRMEHPDDVIVKVTTVSNPTQPVILSLCSSDKF